MPECLTGPVAEPLTLADAKAFLRIDHTAEDGLLAALITAARQAIESASGRILMAQTWRVTRDAWPVSGLILAPLAPVRAVVAARVFTGTAFAALPLDVFTLRRDRAPAVIGVDLARAPRPTRALGGIELDLTLGYGATPADVPADLIQAVRLLTAHLYENRDGTTGAGRLPEPVEALLRPYRLVRL